MYCKILRTRIDIFEAISHREDLVILFKNNLEKTVHINRMSYSRNESSILQCNVKSGRNIYDTIFNFRQNKMYSQFILFVCYFITNISQIVRKYITKI